jgi:phospholipid/cholesterol/gamma-HCH transport system substrate-binding protein
LVAIKDSTLQIKTETIVGIFILVALAIFFYMSFFIGVLRFDRIKYHNYTVYFNDVSGLAKKADVKIAGVKVGWVDKITLVPDHDYQAKADVLVLKEYVLHTDAHAIVRQEGLLGTKYLEIVPGDPLMPQLQPNSMIGGPNKPPASVDEILHKVQDIAGNVQDITGAIGESIGGPEGKHQLQMMFTHFQEAAQHIAQATSMLDRTLSRNEESINSILQDMQGFSHELRESFPAIRDWIEKVSNSLDRDVGRVADKLEGTALALEDAALHARDSFKSMGSVADKIDEGKGLIGKLINEEETYRDLKTTIGGLKNYFSKMEQMQIVVDGHSEYMYRPAEHMVYEDTKGYLDLRVHPSEDNFYLLQLVASQKGTIDRTIRTRKWYDENGIQLFPSELLAQRQFIPELIGTIETTDRKLDQYKFGFQFGKIFKDVALRFGLMENSVGLGIDIDIPFGCDNFRWVTTFEVFDFRGRQRLHDQRPHLKWLNRVFFLRNLYMTFGADDFISRLNANGFFGAGVRFTDDDLKYLLSQIGILVK